MDRFAIYVGEHYLEGFFTDLSDTLKAAEDYSRNLTANSRKYGKISIRDFKDAMPSRIILEIPYKDDCNG